VSLHGFGSHCFWGAEAEKWLTPEGLALSDLKDPMWVHDVQKADKIAAAVVKWGTSHGASYFCHWFQPMASTARHGQSGQVQHSMFEFDENKVRPLPPPPPTTRIPSHAPSPRRHLTEAGGDAGARVGAQGQAPAARRDGRLVVSQRRPPCDAHRRGVRASEPGGPSRSALTRSTRWLVVQSQYRVHLVANATQYWYRGYTSLLHKDNSPRVTMNAEPRSHALTPPF
jgi:hypothetical protein